MHPSTSLQSRATKVIEMSQKKKKDGGFGVTVRSREPEQISEDIATITRLRNAFSTTLWRCNDASQNVCTHTKNCSRGGFSFLPRPPGTFGAATTGYMTKPALLSPPQIDRRALNQEKSNSTNPHPASSSLVFLRGWKRLLLATGRI